MEDINLFYVFHRREGWLTDEDDWSRSFNDATEFQTACEAQAKIPHVAADENECFVFGWVQ